MVMSLNLDFWETLSLNAGCNLYSSKFHLCVLNVRQAHEQQKKGLSRGSNNVSQGLTIPTLLTPKESSSTMFFRERERMLVPVEAFLAISVPKLLIGSLIIFLNVLAVVTMIRSNRWISSRAKGYYVLPQSTQGLLHSLFMAYILLGLLTIYSQVSLSAFLLGNTRFVADQGRECLVVNSLLLGLSLAIGLHLVSLAVDRTLASYLSYSKYSRLAIGTVPLWLLSIWLPSGIMMALPLSGWRNSFRFCIFLSQFNDDYLRFLGGFWLSAVGSIPFLYLFFLAFLRPRREERILYRWHRKLQAHHRLTFILVLCVNIGCWAPFQLFLVLACQSCPYSHWAAGGELLEYLFILALLPAIIIPLMFSLRSSFVDKCVERLADCMSLTFRDPPGPAHGFQTKNPLSQVPTSKSPLFFIDELAYSSATTNSSRGSSYNNGTARSSGANGGSSFFVPHYLPGSKGKGEQPPPVPPPNCHNLKSSFKNKLESCYAVPSTEKNHYTSPRNKAQNSSTGTGRKLRNFAAYLNRGVSGDDDGQTQTRPEEHVYDSLDSDSKYGFPIVHGHGPKNTNLYRHRQKTAL